MLRKFNGAENLRKLWS